MPQAPDAAQLQEWLQTLRRTKSPSAKHYAGYWANLVPLLEGREWISDLAEDAAREEINGYYKAFLWMLLAQKSFQFEDVAGASEAVVRSTEILQSADDLPGAAQGLTMRAQLHRIQARIELKLGRVEAALREVALGESAANDALEESPGARRALAEVKTLRRIRLDCMSASDRQREVIEIVRAEIETASGSDLVKLRTRLAAAAVHLVRRGQAVDVKAKDILAANLEDPTAGRDDLFMARLLMGRLLIFNGGLEEARGHLNSALELADSR
ncbi:MAG: hypothetical protein AAGG01_21710, partial [Planctomycetota bacterium]